MVDSNVIINFSWNSDKHYLLEAICQQVSLNRFDIEFKVSGCTKICFNNVFVTSYNHLFWRVYRYYRKLNLL